MRTDILTDDLRHATAILARSTPKRTTLPILQHALLETVGPDAVRLSTTDLEIGTTMILPADVAEQGRVALDCRALLAAARSAPKESTMTLESTTRGIVATAGPVSSVIPTLPVEEYPSGFGDGTPILDLPAEILRSMILETAHCLSTDDVRPILTGAHVIATDGRLTIETADNYRLARASGIAEMAEPVDLVATGRGLVHWAKSTGDGPATVSRGKGWVSIRSGGDLRGSTVYARVIEGQYPKVDSVIPASWPDHATADRRELLAAARAIAKVVDDRRAPVARVYVDGSITIGTRDGSTLIDCRSGGWADDPHPSDLDIGINPVYLADTLAAIGDETVRIGLSGPLAPIGIESSSGTVHVVMPVRI